jgi:hypothetical protein
MIVTIEELVRNSGGGVGIAGTAKDPTMRIEEGLCQTELSGERVTNRLRGEAVQNMGSSVQDLYPIEGRKRHLK